MNESFSLIKDRCTTCGGGLPCVLHDREMRRVILGGEREESPTFRKIWERNFVNGKAFSIQKTEHGWLYRDGSSIYSVGSDLRACETEERKEVLKFETSSQGRIDVKLSQIHNDAYLFRPFVREELWWDAERGEWRERPFEFVGLPDKWAAFPELVVAFDDRNALSSASKTRVKNFLDYNYNESDLLGGNKRTYFSLTNLRASFVDGERTYILDPVPFSSYESDNLPPKVFLQDDGTLLIFDQPLERGEHNEATGACKKFGYVIGRPPAKSGQWTFERVGEIDFKLVCRPQAERLGRNKYLVCCGNDLRVIEYDQRSQKFSESVVTMYVEPIPSASGIPRPWPRVMGILTEHSFVSSMGIDNELELFEERANGNWSRRVIGASARQTARIIVESPTLFHVISSDGHVERWEPSEDEVRAYHERQVAHKGAPPLPFDI